MPKVERVQVPPALLICRDEPAVPYPVTATDVIVARWEVDLIAAGCDCRDKLAAVKAWQDGKPAMETPCSVRDSDR